MNLTKAESLSKNFVVISFKYVIRKCKVSGIKSFGAFVDLAPNRTGLLHISEVDINPVVDINAVLKEGDVIDVEVLSSGKNGKVQLSRKNILLKDKNKVPKIIRPNKISQETTSKIPNNK